MAENCSMQSSSNNASSSGIEKPISSGVISSVELPGKSSRDRNSSSLAMSSSFSNDQLVDSLVYLSAAVNIGECFTFKILIGGLDGYRYYGGALFVKLSDNQFIELSSYTGAPLGADTLEYMNLLDEMKVVNRTYEVSAFENSCDTAVLIKYFEVPNYVLIKDVIDLKLPIEMYYDDFAILSSEYTSKYRESDSMIYYAIDYADSGFSFEDITNDTAIRFETTSDVVYGYSTGQPRKEYFNEDNVIGNIDGSKIYELDEYVFLNPIDLDKGENIPTMLPGYYYKMIYLENTGLLYFLQMRNHGIVLGEEFISTDSAAIRILCYDLKAIKCK